ncbi:flagellar biosynthesis anti-sigma factor FlgM [Massilia haematophila]|uniref:Negative regulator of flagellin synthesis n=2 Tax=Massilia TaxID=149698 RepID=A0ABV7PSV6_9BURK
MKITGTGAAVVTPSVGGASAPAAAPAPAGAAAPAALESEVLQPATQAMRAMPDFDAARVAELRDALAKGELPFDPARLAGMIQRFHGGR